MNLEIILNVVIALAFFELIYLLAEIVIDKYNYNKRSKEFNTILQNLKSASIWEDDCGDEDCLICDNDDDDWVEIKPKKAVTKKKTAKKTTSKKRK